eukprot:g2987.t1
MSYLLAALLLAHTAAAAVPPTMIAAYKAGILPCKAPFDCVKTHTIATPSPGEGQVLIAVAASSVNPCDVDYLEVGFGCSGGAGTLGMDMAGTVVAVGSGCTRLKVGDRVWADTGALKGDSGGMAQYALAAESQTGVAPASLNLTEAGTIPLAGLTALELFQAVAKAMPGGTIAANKTIVVTAGTGGTGFVALQLAKHVYRAGMLVTSTSGADDIALAKALGADVVVDYKSQDDVFAGLADDSVDIVVDNYGEKGAADKAMRALRSGGVYIILPGGGGGTVSKHPKAGVTQLNFGYTASDDYATLDALAAHFDAGAVKAHVFAQVPLAEAAQAFALSKTGTVAGKVAVVVDGSQK